MLATCNALQYSLLWYNITIGKRCLSCYFAIPYRSIPVQSSPYSIPVIRDTLPSKAPLPLVYFWPHAVGFQHNKILKNLIKFDILVHELSFCWLSCFPGIGDMGCLWPTVWLGSLPWSVSSIIWPLGWRGPVKPELCLVEAFTILRVATCSRCSQ